MIRSWSVSKLRGANRFSSRSVLVGTIEFDETGGPTRHAARLSVPARQCAAVLRQCGLASDVVEEREAWPPGLLAEKVACLLQTRHDASGGQCPGTGADPDREFVLPLEAEEQAALHTAEIAMLIVRASMAEDALPEGLASFRARVDELEAELERGQLPIQTKALAEACQRQDIPWRRVTGMSSVFQLGEGSLQQRLRLTVTSRTTRLATELARDKAGCNRVLARYGLPVARQVVLTEPARAWDTALEIGLPVVIKPRRGNMGKGVSVGLDRRTDVEAAVLRAKRIDRAFIVESFIPGADHRILVAAGQLIAVSKRTPAQVIGDGRHTVGELLEVTNADPRRSKSYRTPLMTIEFDGESERLLAARGYTLESVPSVGDRVVLKSAANFSAGGTTTDLTSAVHPENERMFLRAVSLVGLDVAGVDFLTPDISRSYREVGGGICEINYRPGILNHLAADNLGDRDIADELVAAIHSAPSGGRIPTLLLHGAGADQVGRMIVEQLRSRWGLRAGYAGPSGVSVGDWAVTRDQRPAHRAHSLIVEDPTADVAILVIDPDRLQREGLGVSRADVIAVLDDPEAPSTIAGSDTFDVLSRTGGAFVQSRDPAAIAEALVAHHGPERGPGTDHPRRPRIRG